VSVCLLYLIFVQLVNLLLLLVWVPNWSSTLCDLGVFVYQPAEQIATSKMKVGMTMSQVTAVDELFGTHRLLGPRVRPARVGRSLNATVPDYEG